MVVQTQWTNTPAQAIDRITRIATEVDTIYTDAPTKSIHHSFTILLEIEALLHRHFSTPFQTAFPYHSKQPPLRSEWNAGRINAAPHAFHPPDPITNAAPPGRCCTTLAPQNLGTLVSQITGVFLFPPIKHAPIIAQNKHRTCWSFLNSGSFFPTTRLHPTYFFFYNTN